MIMICLFVYLNVCQLCVKKDMRYESERGVWFYENESMRLDSK